MEQLQIISITGDICDGSNDRSTDGHSKWNEDFGMTLRSNEGHSDAEKGGGRRYVQTDKVRQDRLRGMDFRKRLWYVVW